MMKNSTLAFLLIVLIIFCILITPLGIIWALNTISEQSNFNWQIPHSMWNYISIWVLMVIWKTLMSSKL